MSGPNDLERKAQESMERLIAEREAEPNKSRRKLMGAQIRMLRDMRDWARTRAGYVE